MRGATQTLETGGSVNRFLLTRPMRGATPSFSCLLPARNFYSHAPCGARHQRPARYLVPRHISTHTPHAGRDAKSWIGTLKIWNFYSHAPCGARRTRDAQCAGGSAISTHTPHAGRDAAGLEKLITVPDFYSHAPCGARQLHIVLVVIAPPIYKRRTQKL